MTTKTITITENAYEALRGLKAERESFSETILRVAKRKPLSHFFGALSKESGERLEKEVERARKEHMITRAKRIDRIAAELEGR